MKRQENNFASFLVINSQSVDMIVTPTLSKRYTLTKVTITFIFQTRVFLRVKQEAISNYDRKISRPQDHPKNNVE